MAAEKGPIKTSDLSRVANKEYAEPASGKVDSWKAGSTAPRTVYLDKATGKVTDKEPASGKVVVAEGDLVTESVAAQLKG